MKTRESTCKLKWFDENPILLEHHARELNRKFMENNAKITTLLPRSVVPNCSTTLERAER